MALSATEHLDTITEHCAVFATQVHGHLDTPVEHCPGWTVADLVAHLVDVHWFWATIVDERLQAPPGPERRPARPETDRLVETFEAGARRLVGVLARANPEVGLWTWAPGHQHAGFVLRHQVQEIAIHQWDAAHTTGGRWAMGPAVAADAVDEFLSVSLSTDEDPADPPLPALEGRLVLECTDHPAAWLVRDGSAPGTIRAEPVGRAATGSGAPAPVRATAADLLLWLYGRIDHDVGPDETLLTRLRALTYTD